ncbi:MAG: hypothetical protein SFW36_02460 [Leptolyngbyaceae cyanobacterium bins.59]|nr:hypothetical protein [Leptolyngbyaceae cyanobacterium bins.59]
MQKDVLLLSRRTRNLQGLESMLKRMEYSVTITSSAEQAVARVFEANPCLIILECNHQCWSPGLVQDLRSNTSACRAMIFALTESYAPSWVNQEENPGFDGFLVKPISDEVMASLIQSAWVRQVCLAVN